VAPSKHVIGPDGRRLTLADLPSPNTKRWVVRRKAQVVAAVRGGLLSLEEACSRYALNADEFKLGSAASTLSGLRGFVQLAPSSTSISKNPKGSCTNPPRSSPLDRSLSVTS
jgi:hypothetical protein